jgi:hypothetical protein
MRFFTSILLSTISIGLLAGCSGGMATAPNAGLPGSDAQAKNLGQAGNLSGLVAFQTSNHDFVTAVGGGDSMVQANCGARQIALHENATTIGAYETFTMVSIPNTGEGGYYAFKTSGGYYLTAVNGGGIGGHNNRRAYSQLDTDASTVLAWEKFRLIPLDASLHPKVAIQTSDGTHYITASNGGGCGSDATNFVPFRTNAKSIGRWERFRIINV